MHSTGAMSIPARARGFTIVELMLGIAILGVLVGIAYLVYKLVNWAEFSLGLAPVVIGLFFLGSVQLFFLGIVGEYIGSIYTLTLRRPLVIEKERLNF